MSERENAFGHLDISRRLAAASVKVAGMNPDLSRELADEAKALLAFVEDSEPARDLSTAPDVSDDIESPEMERRFQRVRALQKRMVPVPGEGPRKPDEGGHGATKAESDEPVIHRISDILRRSLLSFR